MKTQVLTPVKPVRVINFAKVLPLFQPVGRTSLMPLSRPVQSAHLLGKTELQPVTLERRPARRLSPAKLQKHETRKFAVIKATGTVSPIAGTEDLKTAGVADLDLPIGMPRFVNAATLKQMFKADRTDLLLKKVGERWEVCENSTRIDLTDDTVEFRLGAVQIFS